MSKVVAVVAEVAEEAVEEAAEEAAEEAVEEVVEVAVHPEVNPPQHPHKPGEITTMATDLWERNRRCSMAQGARVRRSYKSLNFT